MIALKAAYSQDAHQLLLKMLRFALDFGLLRSGNDTVFFLTKYVSLALKLDENAFWGLIEKSDLDKEDIMPTFVETWEQRGVERGIRQGMEKGIHAVAKQMLLEGADLQFISRVTKLSIVEIQKIKNSLD